MPLDGSQTVNLHLCISLFCIKKEFLSKCKPIADTKQYTLTICKKLYIYTSCTGLPGTGTGKNLLAQVSG